MKIDFLKTIKFSDLIAIFIIIYLSKELILSIYSTYYISKLGFKLVLFDIFVVLLTTALAWPFYRINLLKENIVAYFMGLLCIFFFIASILLTVATIYTQKGVFLDIKEIAIFGAVILQRLIGLKFINNGFNTLRIYFIFISIATFMIFMMILIPTVLIPLQGNIVPNQTAITIILSTFGIIYYFFSSIFIPRYISKNKIIPENI